ncbi:ethanolamine ammonia-lyase subunit EutC [Actinospica sp.]|jgi:ethanolamine ammonia-lyase small subunit|uniref:ethanolamine ammonia-lyase subunit EutC n=1 Tax=Actinospica sp. TaxID=1872142 RepID=UPI002C938A02|nr:ethanolamine ammonia-lyase subunit EutC [Actinospica sp.]HWG24824.1 ethanolamine ammonia-lyase subunit EutC [Actinospica sp.]
MTTSATPSSTPSATPAAWVRDLTPARLYLGRAGTSYPTHALLALRADHAAARDAVHAPLPADFDLGLGGVVGVGGVVVAQSRAESLQQYLRRPDLGRRLSDAARDALAAECPHGADVQFVIGDGLSSAAVRSQVPKLLPALFEGCERHGWSIGAPVLVRHCRVGIVNDIGDLLAPKVVVLLIGERPGLATAESLSAYFAYRPRTGHTDAERNLISNIHDAGVTIPDAVTRVLSFISALMEEERSGVDVKEPPFAPPLGAATLTAPTPPPAIPR